MMPMTVLATTSTVETRFDWRDLRFFVVTPEPPTQAQVDYIEGMLPSLKRVGWFADALGVVFGRHVRIRTTRPSPNIWFDVSA
jgi:hypothetical protein